MYVRHLPWAPDAYPVSPTALSLALTVQGPPVAAVWVHYGDRYQTRRNRLQAMVKVGRSLAGDVYQAEVELPTGRFQYLFELVTAAGETIVWGANGAGSDLGRDEPFQFARILERDAPKVPSWVATAVGYHIFPDRFFRPLDADEPSPRRTGWDSVPKRTSFYGGTLRGIREKLPYLADLGITLLYLTPIFRSPSNHRYDTQDYYAVDPRLGSEQDLIDLVAASHSLGMKVILDAVFNHTSDRFFAFREAVRRGPGSTYWDWYFFADGERVNYETFGVAIPSMPKLNFANPAVEDYFLRVAVYWLQKAGIDGWRLDVANEVDHVFWRTFRERVKAQNPEALIVGEVWHDPTPWLGGDQFDGTMNYPFRQILLDYFTAGKLSVAEMARRLDTIRYRQTLPATTASWNLLGSHDTERILTLVDADMRRWRLLMVLLMTWTGIPMLYYGDELGMIGGPDPLCRAAMPWERTADLPSTHAILRALIGLRSTEPALQQGDLILDHDLTQRHVLQFQRHTARDTLTVTLNLSPVSHALPSQRTTLYVAGESMDDNLMPGSAEIWRHKCQLPSPGGA